MKGKLTLVHEYRFVHCGLYASHYLAQDILYGVFMRLTWALFQYHKPATAWLSFSQFINDQNAKLCMITDLNSQLLGKLHVFDLCVVFVFGDTTQTITQGQLVQFSIFYLARSSLKQWATGAGQDSHEFESQTGRMFHGNDFKSSETQLILLSRFSYGLGYLLLMCVLGCWSESDLAACCI